MWQSRTGIGRRFNMMKIITILKTASSVAAKTLLAVAEVIHLGCVMMGMETPKFVEAVRSLGVLGNYLVGARGDLKKTQTKERKRIREQMKLIRRRRIDGSKGQEKTTGEEEVWLRREIV